MEILLILSGIFWSVVCGILADRKKRNPIAWGILGFLFGVFALIVLAVLKDAETKII
jgi:uncharacterized membrane protein